MRDFASERPAIAMEQMRSEFSINQNITTRIKINNSKAGNIYVFNKKIEALPLTVLFYQNIPYTLTATNKLGYKFSHWELQRSSGDETLYSSTIEITPSETLTIEAFYDQITIDEPVVIINEINYNSSPDADAGDWVELFNRSEESIDISSWIITDENTDKQYTFPNNTILAAGAYIVISNDLVKFTEQFNDISNSIGNMAFKLNNSGEVIRLFDSETSLIDSVAYDDTPEW